MGTPRYRISFDGSSSADDLYENIIRLEVEEDVKKAASVMFRLAIAQQEDGEWSYLSDERFALYTKVDVAMGFEAGVEAPLFSGYIVQLAPHFDPQEELCYLEVRGLDATCLMNLEERLVAWRDQSVSDIVTEIFDNYGIAPDVEDAPAMYADDGNARVQRATDLKFLMELAEENGFACYVTVDDAGTVKGVFKPYDLASEALAPLAVHFESETNVQFLDIQVSGNPPLGVTGWHLSLTDKSLEKVEVTDYTCDLLGDVSLPQIVGSKVSQLCAPGEGPSMAYEGGKVFLDAPGLEGMIKGRFDGHGWFMRAKGIVSGESYGAAIRARRIIPVKGLGTRYSGNYFVASVRHVIAEGNYEQHLELIRNAWGVTGGESFAEGGE